MTLDRDTLPLLDEALRVLDEGFARLAAFMDTDTEALRADLGALFDHGDRKVRLELLQADRTGQPGRPRTDDDRAHPSGVAAHVAQSEAPWHGHVDLDRRQGPGPATQ